VGERLGAETGPDPPVPTDARDDEFDGGVRLDIAGDAVARVTLDAPGRRNAQSPAMWDRLTEIGRTLPPSVRVVVLRAEGASFSAGLDRSILLGQGSPSLRSLAELDDDRLDETIAGYQQAFTWWGRPDLVSIAAVQGHAVGAGFQLALACDLRVLADDARLQMKETSLGLVPDLGGTKRLVDLAGYPAALEICATGRWVDAREALELRLANLVVPRDDLDAAVDDLVAAVLAAPAQAVRQTKALLTEAGRRTPDAQRAAERRAQAELLRAITT
jgi:enoyl-CoA hydratase/carnithine racemase